MRTRLQHRHTLGALAVLYFLWLAAWFIGKATDGFGLHPWDQAAAAAVTGLVALRTSRRVPGPYPAFLAMQGLAFLLLAGAWLPTRSARCHRSSRSAGCWGSSCCCPP